MDILGNLKKVLSFEFRAGAYTITFKGDTVTPPTKDITINIPDGDASQTLVTDSSTNTLTNKSIDADSNTIVNIDNDEIKAGAAIDVTKLHDGSVDNTEFGYLDGVTSSIQTQLTDNADDNTGTVTVHSDVSDAGSGAIITGAERTDIGTNTTNNTGPVTIHSDVTDAGSGAIITGTERTDIGLNNTHRGLVTGNPHVVTATDVGLGNVANVDTTDATNITSGTLADARLSSNVDLLDADQTLTGEKTHEKVVLASGTSIDANGNSTLAEPDKTVIALTGVPTVTDIVTITATSTTTGKYIQLQNDTASTFIVRNETGNIKTGSDSDLDMLPDATIILRYDGTDWRIVGGSGGGAGGLAVELYDHTSLPATLSVDIQYLVDISGGNASATLPETSADNDGSKIVVQPINNPGGGTITLSAGGSDDFNDPDLGTDTEYVLDVGKVELVLNNTDSTLEISDAYWAASTDVGQTKWARHDLLTSVSVTDPSNADLLFSNLTIGKTYKISVSADMTVPDSGGTDYCAVETYHGGTKVMSTLNLVGGSSGASQYVSAGASAIFVATTTTLTFLITVVGTAEVREDGTGTWAILEELPQHAITTDWD